MAWQPLARLLMQGEDVVIDQTGMNILSTQEKKLLPNDHILALALKISSVYI
jgi:hypothetical protein